MSQGSLSERDVCTKLITPAVERAGWDIQGQVREEVSLTAGQVMVRGRLVARGTAKRADYVPYLKPNLPLAVIEAKAELDPFIDPEKFCPVIVTTSKLISTSVDAQTYRMIVLDQTIQSMAESKQVIGRGTRIRENDGKLYFTILDFTRSPSCSLAQ